MIFSATRLQSCHIGVAALFIVVLLSVAQRAQATTLVSMAWSPVGNPGNVADPTTGYGEVNYSYNIGTYDVTDSQYVAFLNANDPTGADPLGLYSSGMSNATYGGIKLNSVSPAGSKYSVISSNGNHPVSYVTWYDAVRFANWLDNGQPVYTAEPTATNNATDIGSYTLLGFAPTPSNGLSVTRNPGARIVLPSENEWYKAAYYNPATSLYFKYPTSSNSTPNATGPTSIPNSANNNGAVNNLTDVGAYSGTTSPYGAFDMGGDVFQWNEALINGSFRGTRGGAFADFSANMASAARQFDSPDDEITFYIGFRVASVPEPSTGLLAVVACGLALWCRKRLKRCPARREVRG